MTLDSLIKYGATESFFNEAALYPELCLARIVSQYKGVYKIATEAGESFAKISGKFRYEARCVSDYPAVGDFVMVNCDNTTLDNAIIHRVLTRKSAFVRTAVGADGEMQIVAANIDIVFICMSLNNDYNVSRLERYLSVAWSSRAIPVVVLTKSDLCGDLPAILAEVQSVASDVDILVTSSFDQSSCDKVLSYLKLGLTASFIGSSGVGKSTLVNLIAKEELAVVSAIKDDDKGRHTTTRRELFLLSTGGAVIDTPGMRELGVESTYLSTESFADIDLLVSQCRFSNCSHTNEPSCAIRQALETGSLDTRRFENYIKLKRETGYDGLSYKEIETEKIKSVFGSKSEMKIIKNSAKQKHKRR